MARWRAESEPRYFHKLRHRSNDVDLMEAREFTSTVHHPYRQHVAIPAEELAPRRLMTALELPLQMRRADEPSAPPMMRSEPPPR
eukprot:2248328-Prymnesium_polylepis.1